jgi:hypothetical protein
MDAFDSVFGTTGGLTGSVRRKDAATGITRTVRVERAPAGFTLTEFADAAMSGATAVKTGKDRGADLRLSVAVKGAAARSAVLSLGDKPDAADETEPKADGSLNGVGRKPAVVK